MFSFFLKGGSGRVLVCGFGCNAGIILSRKGPKTLDNCRANNVKGLRHARC